MDTPRRVKLYYLDRIEAQRRKTAAGSPKGERSESINKINKILKPLLTNQTKKQINHNRKGGAFEIEQPEVGPKGESSGGERVKEQR